jgi:predicted phosphoribosyltransferase
MSCDSVELLRMAEKTKKVFIVERSHEAFRDRIEAGERLAEELKKTYGNEAVVLGIPRGGMVVAGSLAHVLGAALDIVLSLKIGVPGNPEFAIGAINEAGVLFLNEDFVRQTGVGHEFIERERVRQMVELKRRQALFRSARLKVPLKNRNVIITDDGIATGATFHAALWAVRQEGPGRLIAAIPVGPEDSLYKLAEDADELVCVRVPDFFQALSQFYAQFDQIEDKQVLEILTRNREGGRDGSGNLEKCTQGHGKTISKKG